MRTAALQIWWSAQEALQLRGEIELITPEAGLRVDRSRRDLALPDPKAARKRAAGTGLSVADPDQATSDRARSAVMRRSRFMPIVCGDDTRRR